MIKTVKKMYSVKNQFCNYEITLDNDKVWLVPLNPANTDYQAIQEWIKEGGEVIDNPPQENN